MRCSDCHERHLRWCSAKLQGQSELGAPLRSRDKKLDTRAEQSLGHAHRVRTRSGRGFGSIDAELRHGRAVFVPSIHFLRDSMPMRRTLNSSQLLQTQPKFVSRFTFDAACTLCGCVAKCIASEVKWRDVVTIAWRSGKYETWTVDLVPPLTQAATERPPGYWHLCAKAKSNTCRVEGAGSASTVA